MAELVYVLESLVHLLRSVENQKLNELVKTELDELATELSQIQAFMEDIGHRNNKEEASDAMVKWMKQLREVVYEAEDIVESTLAAAARLENRSWSIIYPPFFSKRQSLHSVIKCSRETQLKPLLRELFAPDRSETSKLQYREEDTVEYTSKNHKLKQLVGMAPMEFATFLSGEHISGTNRHQQQDDTVDYSRKNHKVAGDAHVIGLDDEIKTLIQYINEESQELDVIPIVGMGGLGKTTLASKLYANLIIKQGFPTRIWVHVPHEFDINSLCRTILKNFTQQDMSGKSTDELGQIVSDNLKMTKYFIVLDDVWGYEAWEKIQQFLPTSNRKGSKVLITTRNDEVAKNASLTRDPYRLKMLCTEKCFELLKFEVFGKHDYFPPELELAGRSMAKACRGLPLAIVVVAGILTRQKVTAVYGTDALRMEWEDLCDSINSLSVDNGEFFLESVLSLSYSKLPPRLRNCFLYLGMFPEYYRISSRKLVLLWTAEGFIEQRPGKSLEETAEAYLNELINRNLLMVEKTSLGGKAKTCRVHDLVRDFCISKATHINTNLFQEVRNAKHGTFGCSVADLNCRRLCINLNVKDFISGNLRTFKVRSLLCFGLSFLSDGKVSKDFIRAFKVGRVFDASIIKFQKFPLKLTQSVHLRYLTLSGNFEILPSALTNLWNLQTLLVYTSARVLEIKADIWELENLRHLRTNASIFLTKGKGRGGQNLQAITKLSPGSFTSDVSNNARNLKELVISGALSGSMCFGNFYCLEKLKLEHSFHDPLPSLPPPDRFPPKLKSLVLSGTKLGWDRMSALEKLSNLEVLKLKDNAFVGESWDVVSGGFRRLEILFIVTTDLKYWTASEDSFAKLRILRIENCRKLEEVPLHLGKNLEVLHLYSVTKFAVYCARKMEQKKELKHQGQQRSPANGLDVQVLHGNLLSPPKNDIRPGESKRYDFEHRRPDIVGCTPAIDIATTLELSIKFGGKFVHVPTAQYIGGGTLVLKNVGGLQMGKEELDRLCATEGISQVKGYYVLDKENFILLQNPMHIGSYYVEGLMKKGGKQTFYVDCKEFPEIVEPDVCEVGCSQPPVDDGDNVIPDAHLLELDLDNIPLTCS